MKNSNSNIPDWIHDAPAGKIEPTRNNNTEPAKMFPNNLNEKESNLESSDIKLENGDQQVHQSEGWFLKQGREI